MVAQKKIGTKEEIIYKENIELGLKEWPGTHFLCYLRLDSYHRAFLFICSHLVSLCPVNSWVCYTMSFVYLCYLREFIN